MSFKLKLVAYFLAGLAAPTRCGRMGRCTRRSSRSARRRRSTCASRPGLRAVLAGVQGRALRRRIGARHRARLRPRLPARRSSGTTAGSYGSQLAVSPGVRLETSDADARPCEDDRARPRGVAGRQARQRPARHRSSPACPLTFALAHPPRQPRRALPAATCSSSLDERPNRGRPVRPVAALRLATPGARRDPRRRRRSATGPSRPAARAGATPTARSRCSRRRRRSTTQSRRPTRRLSIGLLGSARPASPWSPTSSAARSSTPSGGLGAIAANAIARGRLDRRVEVRGRDEFARLGTRVQRDGRPARGAASRSSEAERAPARGDRPLRRGARRDARRRPAPARDRRDGGRGDRRDRRASSSASAARSSRRERSRSAARALRAPARRRPPELRHAHASRAAASRSSSGARPRRSWPTRRSRSKNARLHRIVARQALVDMLTGLANRRHCEEALAGELMRAERFGGSVAFVLADLDSFKSINDRFGHPVGDGGAGRVRRDAARVRARDRRPRPLGRRGVRDRPARDRPRRRRPPRRARAPRVRGARDPLAGRHARSR